MRGPPVVLSTLSVRPQLPRTVPPDREERLPWLGHAYDWPREFRVFWNKAFGPTRRYRALTAFLPRRHTFCAIEPRLRIAFLGDLLPPGRSSYRIGERLRQFVAGADYLVVNLEGVIADRSRVVNAVRHSPVILDTLAELFPPTRTIALCANNHAADCGRAAFKRHYERLQGSGFRVLGHKEQPSLLLPEGVLLGNATQWLNVRHSYVARLEDLDGAAAQESARLRILCPHWGTEMELYPSPSQIRRARQWLTQWDAIVGHHTHCPQPIAELDGRLTAYSLGNLAQGFGGERFRQGLALIATLGPDPNNQWRIGQTEWTFTAQTPQADGSFQIDAAETCCFFDT